MPTSISQATAAALKAHFRAPAIHPYKTPITQRRGLVARLGRLETSHGGAKAAATAAGVTPRTWNAWLTGKSKPSRASLAKVETAYRDDLETRSQTPERQKRAARKAAAAGVRLPVTVTAEIQWDGYYNGQGTDSPKNKPYPPWSDNQYAHRTVHFGEIDISRAVRYWTSGADPGIALQEEIQASYAAKIFLNSYWNDTEVRFTQ